MRTKTAIAIFAGVMFFTLMGNSPKSYAEVSVNVGIRLPLPRVVISAPPPVVVIPGTNAYFAADVGADIFFYQGGWFRRHHGHWYRARDYNGPWKNIISTRVPHEFRDLPPDFRHSVRHDKRIRHADFKKNWRRWEREKRWHRRDHREPPRQYKRHVVRRDVRDDKRWEREKRWDRRDHRDPPRRYERHVVRRDVRDEGNLESRPDRNRGERKHR